MDDDLEAKEYFLGLHDVKSTTTTSENITAVILDILQLFGLQIENLREQRYDAASNMSGIHHGVVARIAALTTTMDRCEASPIVVSRKVHANGLT